MNNLKATQREQKIYGSLVEIMKRENDCTAYRIIDKSGEVVMTSYTVFPGIELIYNDVHMQICQVDADPPKNILEINHCREGRIECEFDNGEYLYLSKGDLSIQLKDGSCHNSYFPLSHYHGISVAIDLDEAPKCLSCILDDVSVDPIELSKKICRTDKYMVMRSKPCFEHIFSELYTIPGHIKRGYFKIKVLELLLFLSGVNLDSERLAQKYFSKYQVDRVKSIKKYLVENICQRITLDELSQKFDIPLTSMKICFKGVYGTTIYSFIRNYKMQSAAMLLKQSDKNIIEIAGMVGYDNGSKFAGAFKKVMNVTPKEYRNKIVQMEPFLTK
ncbi:helix-turn-helix transcriptional regulator [Clostridium estertheticum]|uniref:helix-turn-helix transcriptional regulator n=1 Tax=Clostridium estertheticum TaxID=238834 RepID=UPI001C0C96C0|nr:AraC family transcriptional regulator [Clostridium estertheticum]MBU3184539.1 AraC family transcriptional regulator [Clostridium estertheticum]